MTAIVTRGNAMDLHLPDSTVDLIVTSPPYFGLRSYRDGGEHYAGQVGDEATPTEYIDALIACTTEWMRVLKPGGSIFVNLGDKYGGNLPRRSTVSKSLLLLPQRYALRCTDDLGLLLRAEIIWDKLNPIPESVTDRVRRGHEHLFHFSKSRDYFSALDAIREPYSLNKAGNGDSSGSRRKAAVAIAAVRGTDPSQHHAGLGNGASRLEHPLGRIPGSIWSIPTYHLFVPEHLGVEHFAAYPPELVKRCVLGWSPEDGVVLDPFGGTGTTALVASAFGRVGISVDLSADYCRLAQWRTKDPGERARVLGVDKPPVQVDGQLGMFEGIGA